MQDIPVADFSLPANDGKTLQLSDYRGKTLILYFYPKDATPGCTTQAQGFRDAYSRITELGAVVVGVSRDSVRSHEKFIEDQQLPFDLISDDNETLCNRFGVIKNKKMYGKDVRGIERSTFVIDKNGVLRKEWRGVKVPGHVDEVIAFVETL